jgi:hypothetical protein
MSNVRGSSLSSLSVSGSSLSSGGAAGAGAGDYDDDGDDVKVFGGAPSGGVGRVVPSVGADGGGSDRMVALLERLVSRVERLEEKGTQQSRSVRDRPPTPAPPAASSAPLGLRDAVSHHSGSHSMASYLSGGGARRIAPRAAPAPGPVDLVDNDSEDEQDDAAPAASVPLQTASSAARELPGEWRM